MVIVILAPPPVLTMLPPTLHELPLLFYHRMLLAQMVESLASVDITRGVIMTLILPEIAPLPLHRYPSSTVIEGGHLPESVGTDHQY